MKTLKPLSIFLLSIGSMMMTLDAHSQKKLLIYHETHGFRHEEAINEGIAMFTDLGNADGEWTTDESLDSSVFNASNLSQYDAVIFLNTSGSDGIDANGDLLSGSEKIAFENFIKSGKGFIGIHAATDTYRDKIWSFYNELVGGILQASPNHTVNNYNADIEVKLDHPITSFLSNTPPVVGSIWNKNEEYYYWQINGGQLSTDNTVLLEVASTGPETYDAARPITWYKESMTYDDDNNSATPNITLSGIKSFYTALGHNGSDYSSNTNFRTLLKNAVLWSTQPTLKIGDIKHPIDFKAFIDPRNSKLIINFSGFNNTVNIKILGLDGRAIISENLNASYASSHTYEVDFSTYSDGIYIISVSDPNSSKHLKLMKM